MQGSISHITVETIEIKNWHQQNHQQLIITKTIQLTLDLRILIINNKNNNNNNNITYNS